MLKCEPYLKPERLRKILKNLDALAANPGTPAEGKAAADKAAQLRAKYKNVPADKPPGGVYKDGASWFYRYGGMPNSTEPRFYRREFSPEMQKTVDDWDDLINDLFKNAKPKF